VWNGTLRIPYRWEVLIDPTKHVIKVLGYSPWVPLVSDDDVVPFGPAIEQALIVVCYIEALRRLIGNRVLFTQWQTRSNNTDVTPASLYNDLSVSEQDWQRRARHILVMREAP
ncbi:MAG: hypothetical protein ACRDGQ_08660, partial [Candidatus Limnocylindrales bacterium]